jgi:V/A-type H+-transporting ATPase subunit B
MRLSRHSYATLRSAQGPLVFLDSVVAARMGEVVEVGFPDGHAAEGEVLRIERDTVLVQLIGDSRGIDLDRTRVVFTDRIKRAPLSLAALNRTFGGSFQPLDGLPMFVPEKWAPVDGRPLNPVARERPQQMIETGLSCIDGLNTLVKGQKLPIFSCAGLPSGEIAARILQQARTTGPRAARGDERSTVVFVALGLAHHEYAFYTETLERVRGDYVAFINLAKDPVVERLLAPRFGLTVAEYLAFEQGRDVLVVVTDMTNYCDALREVSTAREELPGRRGYPGYLYSDLASLYERAGRIKEQRGSVTLLPIVTMPEDDITHPVPDLTGYITEGQIVLSRELHQRGLFPPVDVLPSLSRLMQRGIGEGRTRADHRAVANALYRHYAAGRDLRRLEAIVGREGLGESDRHMLDFADAFEREIVHQGEVRRTIVETLDTSRALLDRFGLAIA